MWKFYDNLPRQGPRANPWNSRYEEWVFSSTRPPYRSGRTNGLNWRPEGYGVNRCGRDWDSDPNRDFVRRFKSWTPTPYGSSTNPIFGALGKLDMEEAYLWQGYIGLNCNDPRCILAKKREFRKYGWPDVENKYGIRWSGLCVHERRHF